MRSQTLKEKQAESIQNILTAAANVFSEVGFAGARVDEIAKRAGINKAMIYYRIGDKKALYEAALHDIFADITKQIVNNIKAEQTPTEKLKTFIHNIVRTVDQHHTIVPIMMRELASHTRHFPNRAVQDLSTIVGLLTAILKEGEEKGDFIKTNPFLIHMMIVGTTAFYKMSTPIRSNESVFSESTRKLDKNMSGGINQEIEKLLLKLLKK